MNKRRSGLFLIAFGLVAALAVGAAVFQVTRQATAQKVETVDVVVVLQDVPERTVLTPALVGVRPALPDALPPGALTRPEQVAGQMANTRLYAGEMILASKLVDSNGQSSVAFTLQKSKVLITLPASDIASVGALHPGDHVDLLATVLAENENDSQAKPTPGGPQPLPVTTQTTMQNLVVVAVGPLTAPAKEGGPAGGGQGASNLLTFAISHDDALRLKALKDSKRVRLELVLRAAGDEEIVETAPVTLDGLLDGYRFRR